MNRKLIIAALQRLGIQFDASAGTPILNALLRDTWLTIRNADDPEFGAGDDYDFEMTINGQIGTDYYGDQGYSAKQFQQEIKSFKGKKGLLNIHSAGGNVWDAFAISSMIKDHGNIDTKILGLAASSGDVIFQQGKTRIMPRMGMRMAHGASALFQIAGNAAELTAAKPELDKTIARLEKHNTTLATMYAERSGNSVDDVKSMMDAEEFMDGDESLEKGFCDELTDEMPVTDRIELGHLKKVPSAVSNQFSASKEAGKTKPTTSTEDITVNKKAKIALLNSWGVKLPSGLTEETVTDQWIDDELAKGKPAMKIGREQNIALLNQWGVKFDDKATDQDIENLVAAGKPKAAASNGNGNSNIVNLDDHPTVKAMRAEMERQRRLTIRAELEKLAGDDRIPVNQIQDWENDAMLAVDNPTTGNPVINRLRQLPAHPPGIAPLLNVEVGEENMTVSKLDKVVCDLLKPARYMTQNRIGKPDDETRKVIAARSRQISALINRQKKFEGKGRNAMLVGPLRDAWDSWAAGVQNANTMSADLLRQVILSEIMRAFRREFSSLDLFAHNYKDVALQGTDKVEVPYYPLDQVASTEFVQANGYVMGANAVTNSKEIQVGGKGDGVASSGRGRKYKPLQFSAYEIARQPWLNIAQLVVMAAEQLAIDVRETSLAHTSKQANFGNAIWTGVSGGFDKAGVYQLPTQCRNQSLLAVDGP
jgi:ATP-dependent protease ClpP protease subunit